MVTPAKRLLFVALLAAPLAVNGVNWNVTGQAPAQVPHEEISQPPGWVAFSADGAIDNGAPDKVRSRAGGAHGGGTPVRGNDAAAADRCWR